MFDVVEEDIHPVSLQGGVAEAIGVGLKSTLRWKQRAHYDSSGMHDVLVDL